MSEDLRDKIAEAVHDYSCRATDPDDECGCWCGGDHRTEVLNAAVEAAITAARDKGARDALTALAEDHDRVASEFLGVRVFSGKGDDVRKFRDEHYKEN